jgi:hypothetical protein
MDSTLDYLRARGFHEQTVTRLRSLRAEDQQALMNMIVALRMGHNHVRDVLDWLDEIALRDGGSIATILTHATFGEILTDPRLGRNDKLKRVKEELWRVRFPRLSRMETEIAARIRALKLGPQTQVATPPGLEGGYLTVQLKAANREELRRIVAALAQAVEKPEVDEIFELLGGRGPGEGHDEGL